MKRLLKRTVFIFALLAASGFLVLIIMQLGRESSETQIKRLLRTSREILDEGDPERLLELEEVLAKTLRNFPESTDLCVALIETRLALGDPRGAIVAGKKGHAFSPDNPDLIYLLARAYALEGEDEKAYRLLQPLQSQLIMPRTVWREYINVGRRLWKSKRAAGDRTLEAGDPNAALREYAAAAMIAWDLRNIAEGLASARVHFAMGEIYRDRGDTSRAIQAFRSGLRFDPWREDRQLELARMERDSGLDNAAYLHYRASLKIDPKQPDAARIPAEMSDMGDLFTGDETPIPKHASIIYIAPIGGIDRDLLYVAAEQVREIIRCRIEFLDAEEFPLLTRLYFTRNYDADRIYDVFFKKYRELIDTPGVVGVIGVCNKDLGLLDFPAYVYSWTAEGFALASYLRLDDEFYGLPRDRNEMLRRVTMQLLFCCGRIAGLDMCENVPCAMAYPGTIEEVALKEPVFCARCEQLFHILAGSSETGRDNAIEKLRHLEKSFPDDTAVLMHIGNMYFDSEQLSKAQAVYRRILDLNPAHFDAWESLGELKEPR